jgi:hypothetical protein
MDSILIFPVAVNHFILFYILLHYAANPILWISIKNLSWYFPGLDIENVCPFPKNFSVSFLSFLNYNENISI